MLRLWLFNWACYASYQTPNAMATHKPRQCRASKPPCVCAAVDVCCGWVCCGRVCKATMRQPPVWHGLVRYHPNGSFDMQGTAVRNPPPSPLPRPSAASSYLPYFSSSRVFSFTPFLFLRLLLLLSRLPPFLPWALVAYCLGHQGGVLRPLSSRPGPRAHVHVHLARVMLAERPCAPRSCL